MGDQLRFVDDSGDTRLAGELHDDGATVGDVLTVQSDGSLAAAAGGGSSSPNWAVVQLAVPDNPLTVAASAHKFTEGQVSIVNQSGSDFSVGTYQSSGAIFSAAGGMFQMGAFIGNPADATLDGSSEALRWLIFESQIGTQSDLSGLGFDLMNPILVGVDHATSASNTVASLPGVCDSGDPVIYNLIVALIAGVGTDSIPLDDVFGWGMVAIWQV